jgi:ABC-type multidrug transport system fused ATPase/permease subunit
MLVMLLGSKLVVDGQMTGGALTSYIMYSLTLQSSLVNLSILQGELVKGLGAASRIFESINESPVIPVSGGAQLTDVQGKIEFKDVTFRYPTRYEKE